MPGTKNWRGKKSRGGGRGGRGRGRGGRGGGGGSRPQEDNRVSFENMPKENEKFEGYYNTMNIVPAGPEREAFWAALRRELPNAFRFCGSKGHALRVRDNMVERFFPMIKDIKHEGRPVEIPRQMPWYPEGLAYSMTTPKNVVRKYGPFKDFQKFLVSETGVGNISRQEQVSMIPPLMLDIKPEHAVLDLCAAPGSKSAQLIELLHLGEEDRVGKAIKESKTRPDQDTVEVDGQVLQDDGRSTGMLVANDVDYKRAQMLVHQVKRLNSPNLVVMNHDATMFPSLELPTTEAKPGQPQKRQYLKFDRILADVPCSGDGTCRKNPNIWKDWSPVNGMGLYITQVRILVRSLQMLKVGGKMVYSTCSLNPIENEAVIASAVERCGGNAKVKLVDCSDQLPELVRSPGLKDWIIMAKDGRTYESWPEAEQFEGPNSKVVPGMFPPDDSEGIPLERCMRVYPHQQDTGGFFITVIEKLGDIRAKPEGETRCSKPTEAAAAKDAKNPVMNMVNEIEEAMPDADGRVEHIESAQEIAPTFVNQDTGDRSAAARQNQPNTADIGAASKRKADEFEQEVGASSAGKKLKIDEDPGDPTLEGEEGRKERWPVPPSVGMAIEADGANPGDQAESAPVSTGTNTPAATEDREKVVDAAANAPFERSTATDLPPPKKHRRGDEPANEESFIYLDPSHPELESIHKFYQVHPRFPRDRFLVRNPAGDPVKGIYYTSKLAKDVLQMNAGGRGMKFVHAGVKMFMKQDSQGQDICRWRIQTEGLPIIEGWVGQDRVITMHKKSTLRKLLVEMFPKVGNANDPNGGWKELGELGPQVLNVGMGCCVLRVEASNDEDGFQEPITLPLWRSMHSLNLMLPKEDRKAMLLRIFNEDVELVNHHDMAKNKEQGADRRSDKPSDPRAEEPPAAAGAAGVSSAETAGLDAEGQQAAADEITAASLETRLLEREDQKRAADVNAEEDDDLKIAKAMPEREGEEDRFNKDI
ncbi:hypothetical protein MBLNU230_g4125t1 [Neophaeotheca triangularis]